jgi:hypothetical protein
MKSLIALSLLVLSTTAFADKCKISSAVNTSGSRCEQYVTNFNVASKQECKEIAQNSRASKFFGILKDKEVVLKTTYKYKKTSPGYKEKVKETIHFVSQEEIEDTCLF